MTPPGTLETEDTVTGMLVEKLKYGENPYMNPAGFYVTTEYHGDPLSIDLFELVTGDERSLVGLTDVNWLLQILTHIAAGFEFNFGDVPFIAAGVKHGNACGAAVGDDPVEVIRRMVAGDKRAIFGGVVMTNFPVTAEVAEALMERDEGDPRRLFDGIFAPSFSEDAPDVLARKGGKCRMMANDALSRLGIDSLDETPRRVPVRGGYLLQPNYTFVLDIGQSKVYGNAPSDQELRDMVLAWGVGCVSNSNTITLVRDGQLLGNGVGQQDRVGAAELAIKRALDAGHNVADAVAWSDSFFPAPDAPEVLAMAGISAIHSTSGSVMDDASIEVCERYGISLLLQPDKESRGFAKH